MKSAEEGLEDEHLLAKQLANGIGQGEMLQVKMLDSKNHKKLSLILVCFQIFDPFGTWCCCLSSRDPSGAQVRLPDQMLVTLRFRRGCNCLILEFQHICYICNDFSLWEEGTVRPQCIIRQTPWSYHTWHSDMNTVNTRNLLAECRRNDSKHRH